MPADWDPAARFAQFQAIGAQVAGTTPLAVTIGLLKERRGFLGTGGGGHFVVVVLTSGSLRLQPTDDENGVASGPYVELTSLNIEKIKGKPFSHGLSGRIDFSGTEYDLRIVDGGRHQLSLIDPSVGIVTEEYPVELVAQMTASFDAVKNWLATVS